MKSHAQAGQDTWVHDLIGDTGYFVDVGAHDGIVHSNTFALEQLGWTGICIEPECSARQELLANRRGLSIGYAMSDHAGTVTIQPSGDLVECRTLRNVLEFCRAPPTIDYLSIDVEGHELEVLDGMDFDRWHVSLATIEHNLYCDGPARKEAIAEIMFAHGFERVAVDVVAEGYGPYEDWWQHRDD